METIPIKKKKTKILPDEDISMFSEVKEHED